MDIENKQYLMIGQCLSYIILVLFSFITVILLQQNNFQLLHKLSITGLIINIITMIIAIMIK